MKPCRNALIFSSLALFVLCQTAFAEGETRTENVIPPFPHPDTLAALGLVIPAALLSVNPKLSGVLLIASSPIVAGMATDSPSSKTWHAVATGVTVAGWGAYNYSELSKKDRYSFGDVFIRNAAVIASVYGIGVLQEHFKTSASNQANFQAIPTTDGMLLFLSYKF